MGELMFYVVAGVGYFVAIPAATFLRCERNHRLRWVRQTRMLRAEGEPGAPFRTAAAGGLDRWRGYVVERRGAPATVKVVATTSLVLGHMFVPGLLMGLLGLLYCGLGVIAVPGLLLAARIYRNAFGLLRCEPEAALEAWSLRRFAIRLNVVVLGLAAVWATMFGFDPLAIFTTGYAVVSLVHARGLGLAAAEVAAVHRVV